MSNQITRSNQTFQSDVIDSNKQQQPNCFDHGLYGQNANQIGQSDTTIDYWTESSASMYLVPCLLLICASLGANGFTCPSRDSIVRSRQKTFLWSSKDNGDLDSIRAMLEASWDSDTMGQVPSDARIAANEAFSSILSAVEKNVSVCFIDLLLPSYDVTLGSNLYDEVLAVEYCIALADCLNEKSFILVRDDKTVQTVQRILNLRERDRLPPEPISIVEDISINDEEVEDMNDDDDAAVSAAADDDEYTPSDSGMNMPTIKNVDPQAGVDLFRQQLLSSWSSGNDTQSFSAPVDKKASTSPKSNKEMPEKRYRLGSLFGNVIISDGPDMMEKVVETLRVNALPTDEEDTMIILSAITREEMIAVRSLVAKYCASKKILLVNCKLNPIPKELYGAETVYSILPLIARESGADSQIPRRKDENPPPKVVVLRRYPGDWQVFVDVGKGFKLAKTAPSDLSNKRGPPMKWVQQSVQNFMKGVL